MQGCVVFSAVGILLSSIMWILSRQIQSSRFSYANAVEYNQLSGQDMVSILTVQCKM